MLRGNAADLLGGLDGARVDGGAEGHMVQRLGVGLGILWGCKELVVKSPPFGQLLEEGHRKSCPHTAAFLRDTSHCHAGEICLLSCHKSHGRQIGTCMQPRLAIALRSFTGEKRANDHR